MSWFKKYTRFYNEDYKDMIPQQQNRVHNLSKTVKRNHPFTMENNTVEAFDTQVTQGITSKGNNTLVSSSTKIKNVKNCRRGRPRLKPVLGICSYPKCNYDFTQKKPLCEPSKEMS